MSREYTFRWDPDLSLLWAGERSYPAHFRRESARDHIPPDSEFLTDNPYWRMETRQATVWLENQWNLSTVWGDATYSSNSWQHFHFDKPTDFIEEPTEVEVGLLKPTGGLWGEPIGYVTVPEYHRLADVVMMLPNDIDLPEPDWSDVDSFVDLMIVTGMDRSL